MSKDGQLIPGLPAEEGDDDHAGPLHIERRGHGLQLPPGRRNLTSLDNRPLGRLHPGLSGTLLDGAARLQAIVPDEPSEHLPPGLTAVAGGGPTGTTGKHNTHILITPDATPCQEQEAVDFDYFSEYVLI